MEQVKEAFSKVKQDIDSLKKEMDNLSKGLIDTRERLIEICEVLKTISKKNEDSKLNKTINQEKLHNDEERTGGKEEDSKEELNEDKKEKKDKEKINQSKKDNDFILYSINNLDFFPNSPNLFSIPKEFNFSDSNIEYYIQDFYFNYAPAEGEKQQDNEDKPGKNYHSNFNSINLNIPTHNSQISTVRTNIPTDNLSNTPFKPLKEENSIISTGNKGVPTNRQTNQQTVQHTENSSYNTNLRGSGEDQSTSLNSINNAAKILDSLDNLKKEIRLKFKRLTEQEFLVFSLIYELSETEGFTDYKNLSLKLNLSESSIRDYIGRLIKKGIPVDKTKINNKTIQLSIPPSLKKVASLPTILQLRAI